MWFVCRSNVITYLYLWPSINLERNQSVNSNLSHRQSHFPTHPLALQLRLVQCLCHLLIQTAPNVLEVVVSCRAPSQCLSKSGFSLRSFLTRSNSVLKRTIPSALHPFTNCVTLVLSYLIPPLVYTVGTSDWNSRCRTPRCCMTGPVWLENRSNHRSKLFSNSRRANASSLTLHRLFSLDNPRFISAGARRMSHTVFLVTQGTKCSNNTV
jgi:hypothetical protein